MDITYQNNRKKQQVLVYRLGKKVGFIKHVKEGVEFVIRGGSANPVYPTLEAAKHDIESGRLFASPHEKRSTKMERPLAVLK